MSTFRILVGDIGALSLQLECNECSLFYIRKKLNTTKCSYLKSIFFLKKNENLFKNLNSLNFRSVPFI